MAKVYSTKINQQNKERSFSEIFNELNIRYRICDKFQPEKDKSEGNLCFCNRKQGEHTEPVPTEGSEWSIHRNTIEVVNPDHGTLRNGAWYARLALDTPVEKVEKILREAWKIPKPRLIMSIIGGKKYFTLSDRLETNFINGIIDVGRKSDAWFLTNGYNVGIVQLVGQAISKLKFTNPRKPIVAIGICKWGSVKNFQSLRYQDTTKQIANRSNTLEDDQNQKKPEHGECDLELNHSHYLMLDDGTIRYYDTKDYRTRLAVQIGKLQDENDFPHPVVTIVVEGGKDTIANIYYDLRENIPIIIIGDSGRVADFYKRWLLYTKEFDNITKEADWEIVHDIDELKGEVISSSSSSESSNQNGQSNSNPITTIEHTQIDLNTSLESLRKMFHKYKDSLENDLKSTLCLNEKLSERVGELVKQVMYCLQPAVRSNITVFNLNSDSNLSETIFRSICQSCQKYLEQKEVQRKYIVEISQRRLKPPVTLSMKTRRLQSHNSIHKQDESAMQFRLLELSMSWDCIDVAKELILKNSLGYIREKEKLLLDALKNNLSTFVYEFIKLGINPNDIFFPNGSFFKNDRYKKFITDLYTTEAVNSDKTHLKHFIQGDTNVRTKQILKIETLNDILADLIGDCMYKLYFNNQKDENEHRVRHGLIKKKGEDDETANEQQSTLSNKKQQLANDYIMRDLFIWSILMNHIDMAKVLLSHMKYRICPALIATKILKQYHHKATYGELKNGYLKSAKYFEQYAINCLHECDDHDPDQACEIILQRNELYGYVTCLQVAADAKDKLFIAAPCCVQAMDNIWYDKIFPEKSWMNKFVIMIGIVTFGLLAPPFVTFRMKEEGLRDEALEQTLEYHGINYSDSYALEYPHYIKTLPINRYVLQVIHFHRASYVKCSYHIINYIFFLLLFSYVLLFNFNPPTNQTPSIHWTEILTIILVSSMLIEEIHFFFTQDNITFLGKWKNYFRDLFKLLTVVAFILFIIGLIVRFTDADTESDFTAARVIMAIDLELWWLRSLSFIIVIPVLGPHLVAIRKMLKDLLFFMLVIVIVMAGYGVASRSMVYYPKVNNFTTATGGFIDTSFDGRSVFRQIAYPVYYFLYGEFGNELDNLDSNPNAGWSIATEVLLAIHMMFVNILLINLLIAIFSKRYDEVFEDTKNIWHSQQYLFTREYYTRSPLFPPISLVYYLCRMFYLFIRWQYSNKAKDYQAKVFKMIPIHEIRTKEWYEFEGASTYEYAHAEVKASTKSNTESDLYNIVKKEDMTDKTNKSRPNSKQIQDDLTRLDTSIERIKEELKKSIEDIKGEFQQSIGTIKGELKKSIEDTKGELQQSIGTIKGELDKLTQEIIKRK